MTKIQFGYMKGNASSGKNSRPMKFSNDQLNWHVLSDIFAFVQDNEMPHTFCGITYTWDFVEDADATYFQLIFS